MKLGVLTVLFSDKTLDDTLAYLKKLGVQAVEIGCGGYPGTAHCDPEILLSDSKELQKFKDTIAKYDMTISALSAHGNAVHPDKVIAAKYHKDFMNACRLAEKLNIDRVVTFSGCPGDHEGAKYPNWVTCAWPDDYQTILEWQWNEVLIPYWQSASKLAANCGVDKISFEMHPGFCVYNPESLLKLREEVGPSIGANFDPSHLFWQGIDPVAAIMALKGAIYHFHAKDTAINEYTSRVNGVLDTKSFTRESERSWLFRTIGYGHSEQVWRDMVSALRMTGYDHVMSIEHEDSLMTSEEGLEKAVAFLKNVMIFQDRPSEIWWA